MKTRFLMLLLILVTLIQFCYLIPSSNSQTTNKTNDNLPVIELSLKVLDIDITQKTANLNFFAVIDNVPHNKSCIVISMGVDGQAFIYCNNTGSVKEGLWSYAGESEKTAWLLYGNGESFPFDSYLLRFNVIDVYFIELDFDELEPTYLSLNKTQHRGLFMGSKGWMLNDAWSLNTDGLLPIDYLDSTNIVFKLQRTWGNIFMLSMQFIMPSMLCYFLLGFSSMLSPKRLSERLRIYLPIFFFVPTFLFAIQNFLPYRSSLTLPEFLLYNLLLSNTIFAIFSIIGHEKHRLLKYNLSSDLAKNRFLSRKYDLFASAFSLAFYTIMTLFTGATKPFFSGFISLNVLVLSYCIPIFVALPSRRNRYLIIFFAVPNILLLIVGLIGWLITGQFF